MARRHLNESQRGMVGARLANLQQGGDRKSDKIKSAIAPLKSPPPVTQKQAAEMLNVGVDGDIFAHESRARVSVAPRKLGRPENLLSICFHFLGHFWRISAHFGACRKIHNPTLESL